MSARIVFIGDSITDAERTGDLRGRGHGYVDLLFEEFTARGADVEIVNRGIAGNRVAHLRERWQADVLDLRPDVLTVYIGVNDTLCTFFQGTTTSVADFECDLDDILARACAAGIGRIIVIEPFFVEDAPWAGNWKGGSEFARADLDRKRPVVRMLAERYGADFLPLQDHVTAAVAERGGVIVAPDGVHPSGFGHRLISRLWLEVFDAKPTSGERERGRRS
jgi:lysophospholipase L1-like esterase